jgi:hypothetical protein
MLCLLRALSEIGAARGYQKVPFTQAFACVLCYRLIDFFDAEPLPDISTPFVTWLESQFAATCRLGKQIADVAPFGPVRRPAPKSNGTASDLHGP